MSDIRIYVGTIVFSILCILPDFFCNNNVTSVVAGIGCSGLAAAIMAIFLGKSSVKREKEKQSKVRKLYFYQLNNQLTMLIERTLWFEERLKDESFDWSKNLNEYLSLNYIITINSCYSKQKKKLSFDEAIAVLENIGKKYNIENIKNLSHSEKEKVQKMFLILSISTLYLEYEAKVINNDKLLLEVEDYISSKDNNEICEDISYIKEIMGGQDKNYEAAIIFLLNVSKKVRAIGNFKNDIRIELHSSLPIAQL